MVPRIHLRSLLNSDLAKVKKWCNVAVVHLVSCVEITTFSIGELVSLRELLILKCSKLAVLSWTQDIGTEGDWGRKLWFVKLSYNKSLKILPNFSNCSELRSFSVKECSSLMEPLQFHNYSHLEVLYLGGSDAPEVQSLQSCQKLRSVRLRWNAMQKGLPLLDELPCLSKLEIKGASDSPKRHRIVCSSFLGRNKLFSQHPKDNVRHDFTRIRGLTKLERVFLSCIPLGNLPGELAAIGSTLQSLNLRGCSLSQVVDFSVFPNLRDLQIRWTNVEEVCGLERLTKLRYLDCSFCFQLQKVSDLRPLSELQKVDFLQCPNLRGIPRLPPRLFAGVEESEDVLRATLAVLAFAKTAPLPPHGFAIGKRARGISSQNGGCETHRTVTCDGCMMFPLRGPRHNAKPVQTVYSLCSNCFSERCRRNQCGDTGATKLRWEATGVWRADYDLCSSCYEISRCASKDFYTIQQTLSEQGQGPTTTGSKSQAGSVSGLSASYHKKKTKQGCGSHIFFQVDSSPFRMPKAHTKLCIGALASREY